MEEESVAEEMLLKDRETGFVKETALSRAQKGGGYQMKIAALFVILVLTKENIRYNLSMEDKSAGKFDDLVLKVLHHAQYICWFLQAKHKEKGAKITLNDLLFNQKGEFNLQKYFKSFLDTWKRKGSAEASVSRYVIYTPAHLDFDNCQPDESFSYITSGNNSLRFRKVTEDHDLLDASSYVIFELLKDECIKRHLIKTPGATDENIQDFLQRLRFAVGQPTVEELSDILLKKVKEANTHLNPKTLRDNIDRDLHSWFIGYKPDPTYFTEMQVAKIILQPLSETCKTSLLLDVTFSSCDLIGKILQTNRSVIHVSTTNPKLCCNKLIKHPDVSKDTLLLHFQDLVKARNIVLPSLLLSEEPLIVVGYEAQDNSEMWNETFKSLVERFKFSKNKQSHLTKEQKRNAFKLIFVSKMSELHKYITCVKDDAYSINSLSCQSQNWIMEKVVIFQEIPVVLRTLCSGNCMPPLDSFDIETLVSQSNITLGEHTTSIGNKLEIFIPRKFYVKTLDLYSLGKIVDEIFVVEASQ